MKGQVWESVLHKSPFGAPSCIKRTQIIKFKFQNRAADVNISIYFYFTTVYLSFKLKLADQVTIKVSNYEYGKRKKNYIMNK